MSSLRDNCPISRAFVEDFERVFGKDQIKVTFIDENGTTAGKPGERGVVPTIYGEADLLKLHSRRGMA